MNTKPNNYIYSDTLMHKNGHFKYIKKVKGKNGKTRYYYEDSPVEEAGNKGVEDVRYQKIKGKAGSKYGSYVRYEKDDSNDDGEVKKTTLQVKRGKEWFRDSFTVYNGEEEVKTIGIAHQRLDDLGDSINKGKKWLMKLFGVKQKKPKTKVIKLR